MTEIMSHGFHTCDSLEHMTWFMDFDLLKNVVLLTQTSQLMDFIL